METAAAIAAIAIPLLALLDAENLVSRLRPALALGEASSDDYTILVPIYGNPRYLLNGKFLRRHKAHVILVVNTNTAVMRRFATRRLASGWRVHRVRVETTHSPMDMITHALGTVTTTYVIRLDADTWADEDIGRAVAAMERAGADLCSAKVIPDRRETIAEKMQCIEYDMAMQGRHHRPWMTSGAITLARTEALRSIMKLHSNYFYGEDIEVGKIAKSLGLNVKHVNFSVYTEVPRTFRDLFQQRRGWWCGSFRSAFINFDKNLRFPVFWLYNTVLVWLLMTGKFSSGLGRPEVIPAMILIYTGLIVICNWPSRTWWMVLFPYYSLAQVIVMPIFGVARYYKLAYSTGLYGRYRFPLLGRGPWRRPIRATPAGGADA